MPPRLKYGPRMKRFALRPPESDRRINLLIGSVRSGKTWGCHHKALYLCDYPVAGRRLFTGVSKASIYTNVLTDLFDLIGPANYKYNRQSGELRMFGTEWTVMGAKDEGSEKYLRGSTVGAAICDEVVLMPLGYWQMLLSRMSPPGARLYGSSNADSPFHWLKTDYLDNEELRQDGMLWWDTFTMDDNPNLDPDYVASQKKLYTGVFYKRFIEGLWVAPAGAIYGESWSDATLYDESSRPASLYGTGGHAQHLIVVDYGTTNPCVFLDGIDDARVLWIDREYYWDSAKRMRQKTDAEYADDLQNFIAESRVKTFAKVIVDPSAASFKAELEKRGIFVQDADNNVLDGIRRTSSALKLGKIRVRKGDPSEVGPSYSGCPNTEREMQSYAWNEKRARAGEEEPVKVADHTCDCVRYFANEIFSVSWRLMQ